MAHIGVIQWLIENGYTIRSISGSSMGALVGGIYAANKLEVYAEWVLALERTQVFLKRGFAHRRNAIQLTLLLTLSCRSGRGQGEGSPDFLKNGIDVL